MPAILANWRVPLFYAAFDNSGAVTGPTLLKYEVMLMAQKTAEGMSDELEMLNPRSGSEAGAMAGAGSMAHRMAEKFFENNEGTTLKMILVDDPAAGVAATQTLTVVATSATETALWYSRINGEPIDVLITIGDDETTIALSIVAAINAKTILPFTAAAVAGVVTLTAKNKGENGNEYLVEQNYDSQSTPGGVAVTIADGVEGSGTIDIDEIITILGDEWFQVFLNPFIDTVNLNKLNIELERRFGEKYMIDGFAFSAKRGTVASLSTWGGERNDKHLSVMNSEGIKESPEEFACAVGGNVAHEAQIQPAVPFQTLVLVGITPPEKGARNDGDDNNDLLFSGISTFYVVSNVVRIQACITMYQVNEFGDPDTSYLYVNDMLTLMYYRFDIRSYFQTKYPRALLADDGQTLPSNVQIMTPSLAKSEFVNRYQTWVEEIAIAENLGNFKKTIYTARDLSDKSRLNFSMHPDLMNQLRVFAGTIGFIK